MEPSSPVNSTTEADRHLPYHLPVQPSQSAEVLASPSSIESRSPLSQCQTPTNGHNYSTTPLSSEETIEQLLTPEHLPNSTQKELENEEKTGNETTPLSATTTEIPDLLEDTDSSYANPEVPLQLLPDRRHRALIFGCQRVDRFKKLNKISEGTYGTVYRAQDKETGEYVALKHIKYHKQLWAEGFPITSLREISILLEMYHENILLVKEVVVGSGPNEVFMVMEYIEHELKLLLEENKPDFTVSERKCLLLQLLQALEYMHQNWVIHRDLKTSNILYSNQGILKVCDFGMARKFSNPIRPYTKEVVTLWYRAPEVILGQRPYTQAIDIWSVGCIFAEMILKNPLFPGTSEHDTLKRVFKLCGTPSDATWPGFSQLPGIKEKTFNFSHSDPCWREHFPPVTSSFSAASGCLSDIGLNLLQRLLDPCPERRITASEAMKHDYFLKEKPRPQHIHLMPTVPDTNSQVRKRRRRDQDIDVFDMKQQEAFHDASSRFDGRVNAAQFLSMLETQSQPASKGTAKLVSRTRG